MTICLNTYTPNRYLGHASFEAQMTHDYILSFKSGRSAAQKRAARQVCLALSMTKMENVVFACVPASCNRTNTLRYRNFSQMVCERTGATNAYGHIIINGKRSKLHRSKAHMVCDAANEEIHLDPDMFNASDKMIELGTSALTDAELLSIIIGSGTHKASAVDIAKHLLADHQNNLHELGKAEFNEICETEGIGTSTACRIMAAIELGKRRQMAQMGDHPDLSTACRVHQFMQPFCQDLKVEEAHLLLMNQNYRLIKHVKLSQGGITETLMDIRLIMKYAVTNNATILTVVHNHPSENPRPSHVDDEITKSINNACKVMRIHFCDHVIVCSQEYYSFRENGKL